MNRPKRNRFVVPVLCLLIMLVGYTSSLHHFETAVLKHLDCSKLILGYIGFVWSD